MDKQDFTTGIQVSQAPARVFEAINNVRGWWSENIAGCTDRPGCEFLYHYQDIHRSKIKVVEAVPDKKVVWVVEDNYFKFTRDKSEWKGTKVIFEIMEKDGRTAMRFTHEGLVPQYECYEVCQDAWSHYIQDSLRGLIETGKGEPTPKAGGETYETDLIERRGLKSNDLILSFEVNQTPERAFDAITDVRGWWGEGVEGGSRVVGDEFVFRHKDVHFSKHRLTEVVPGKRVVWLTTDSQLNFVDNKNEWTGTTVTFDIDERNGKTIVRFTHEGLTPVLECYSGCVRGWEFFINDSLQHLIVTGKGKPGRD